MNSNKIGLIINIDKMEYIVAESIKRYSRLPKCVVEGGDSYKYLKVKSTSEDTSEVVIKIKTRN